ncbi:MAG: hypothetical protein KDB27_15715 [Planctomycetales bacterium]|nr:hypothetical protein [Planctomycetales bacterium]
MIKFQRSDPSVVVLVDLDNIELHGGQRIRISWDRFFKGLNEYRIYRAIGYKPERFLSPAMKSFYYRSGLEVCPTVGNADSWFLADSIRLANRVDLVIFLTGDICTLPFIPLLEATGVSVEIHAWRNSVSRRLIDSVRRFVPLSEEIISTSCEYRRNSATRRSVEIAQQSSTCSHRVNGSQ